MAISLVTGGNLSGGANNGGNVVITLPTLLQNDVVYLVAGRVGGATVSTANYTQVGADATNGTHIVRVYRKRMGATPDGSVTVVGSGNAADAMAVALYCLRGVDKTTSEDATATTANGSSTNPNNAAIVTATANASPKAIVMVELLVGARLSEHASCSKGSTIAISTSRVRVPLSHAMRAVVTPICFRTATILYIY